MTVEENESSDTSDIIRDVFTSFKNTSEKFERKAAQVLTQALKCGYMK